MKDTWCPDAGLALAAVSPSAVSLLLSWRPAVEWRATVVAVVAEAKGGGGGSRWWKRQWVMVVAAGGGDCCFGIRSVQRAREQPNVEYLPQDAIMCCFMDIIIF